MYSRFSYRLKSPEIQPIYISDVCFISLKLLSQVINHTWNRVHVIVFIHIDKSSNDPLENILKNDLYINLCKKVNVLEIFWLTSGVI